MYIKRRYGLSMIIKWTFTALTVSLLYSGLVVALGYYLYKYHEINISIAWQPVSILGTAVAFYLGFKNNASYDRLWEARKIWGSIVNNSRSFAAQLIAYTKGNNQNEIVSEIIHRHIAWLTALRYQLRLEKEWGHTEERLNNIFVPNICELYYTKLDEELMSCISDEEFEKYKNKSNLATHIMLTQSKRLQELRDQEYFEDFRHMELQKIIHNFYEDQGKSERIKTFPFPRQYASIALWLTLFFAVLPPFGIMDVCMDRIWLTIPLSTLIIWVFYLMEKIGDYSENPFEGTYNDVPITSISNTIEIDLKEMINNHSIPSKTEPVNGFLM